MEKSLQILMKKTQNECDNIFRLMTMHSNALAGLHIIKKEVNKIFYFVKSFFLVGRKKPKKIFNYY